MISALSIGISNYHNSKLNIPCAYNDALKVYDSFRDVMEGEFHDQGSVCLDSPSASQFLAILQMTAPRLTECDVFILYFSGHARVYHDTLELMFKDGDRDEGYCTIQSIGDILRRCVCNALIILDCCQSGGAAEIATIIQKENQIGVLASCGIYESARYTEYESVFTASLCCALKNMSNRYEGISIVTLSKELISVGYLDASINVGTNNYADFVLKEQPNYKEVYANFTNKFLIQLKRSNAMLRESLWYSLIECPQSIAEDLFRSYFSCTNPVSEFAPEASWILRRAVASAVAQFDGLNDVRKLLLHSLFWQEQCIGIIASRYQLRKDAELFKHMLDMVSSKRITNIDALWLANLYLSENSAYDYKFFLSTDLGRSGWGLIEIYKVINRNLISDQAFIDSLKEYPLTEFDKKEVRSYLHFISRDSADSRLNSVLLGQNSRGKLPQKPRSKFLLSALYGTWRGHINLELQGYLETTIASQIRQELLEASALPDIDHKMALFAYFADHTEYMKEFEGVLGWGLRDVHPRVRTAAVKAFKSIGTSADEIYPSIMQEGKDMNIYPGFLDLFLECPTERVQIMLDNLNKSGIITRGEAKSLMAGLDIREH